MDSVINKTNVCSSKTALDDFFEEKVDFDVAIADYCPAAARILKCDVTPTVLSKSIDSERLTVDVQCVARIVYADEDNGCIRAVTKTETFSRTLSVSEQLSACKVRIGIRPVSVNCRLQNPRRVFVKSVIATAVKIVGNCDTEMIDSIDGGEIKSVFKKVNANVFAGSGECSSRVEGSMQAKPDITDIICSDAYASVNSVKVISDKVIVKGETNVSCLYMTGETTDSLCFCECVIPFSDVIDVDGAEENSLCDVNVSVSDIRCDVSDSQGEISVDAGVNLTASVYNPTEINLLNDVYSMKNELSLTDTRINVESFCDSNKFTQTVNGNVPCELKDARIIGVTSQPTVKSVSSRDGMLVLDGEMYVTLYMCNEEEYKLTDKAVPFSVSRPIPECDGNLRCEANAVLKNISYTMPDDDTVAISAVLDITLNCFNSVTHTAIDSFEEEPDKPHKMCKGVLLYFAERGEHLWDIAKRFHSSVENIKRDNTLDAETLTSPQMLLISFN